MIVDGQTKGRSKIGIRGHEETMPTSSRNHRHSVRLPAYDYSAAGMYFVTVCTHLRECFLGEVAGEVVEPSEFGLIVQQTWNELPTHYTNVELDAFVLMPNHIHGILVLRDTVGAGLRPAPTETKRSPLSEIVRGFKSFSARRINQLRNTSGGAVWQRNYYEHVIRNQAGLNSIRQYILSNPAQWALDKENPDRW